MLKRISEGTMRTVCSKIAAVSNYAMINGLLREEDYCFKRLKYAHIVKKLTRLFISISRACLGWKPITLIWSPREVMNIGGFAMVS